MIRVLLWLLRSLAEIVVITALTLVAVALGTILIVLALGIYVVILQVYGLPLALVWMLASTTLYGILLCLWERCL